LDVNRFKEMLEGKKEGKEITSSKIYSLQSTVLVPAKTVLILDIK